jgi:hypothetical protein
VKSVEQNCGGACEVFYTLGEGKGEEYPTAILYFLDPSHNFCVPLIFDTERFKRNPHMPFRRCLRNSKLLHKHPSLPLFEIGEGKV